jgi:hypothetical protein
MPHATVGIIRAEHAALAAMLRSIVLLLDQHRRDRTQSSDDHWHDTAQGVTGPPVQTSDHLA